ncbi:Fur family transcriptional regulator [Mesotoga sp. BH458_6_3_2_1]|uniref:Fur family transcriptional regulator n=1 Tax=Mesotoga sp. BH458_6_3_2_1 TaxID=1437446 RepID=UPI000EF1FD75|nr:transcriptional repressor [Mesotoga sp. BH458_6_3_2_1]RLL84172.1 Fur family transcriptional regulator [Mesotoga sp. BH458_6_3_2_1]
MRKLTSLRREILEIINNSDAPLNADSIHEMLIGSPNLSSVYRSLAFLEEEGLIRSVSFECETRFYFSRQKEPIHFLHCKKCHKTEPFYESISDSLAESVAEDRDFTITGHVFYFIGICGECKRKIFSDIKEGKI